jgi:hypothetical protein
MDYIFSQGTDGSRGKSIGSYFIVGRVKSIVLGEYLYDGKKDPNYVYPSDIGKISYETLYTNINISKANNSYQDAYPIFSAVKQLPLISEIVLIVPGPDSNLNDSVEKQGYYYFPPYSLWNSVNHNAFPNLKEYSDYLKKYSTIPGYNGKNSKDIPDLPLGNTIKELEDVKSLRLFEGDTVFEGRFGQSIRFGSTVNGAKSLNKWSNSDNYNSPITIIRNGQNESQSDKFSSVTEDFNSDDCGIWLMSGQQIPIEDQSSFPLRSFDRYSLLDRVRNNDTNNQNQGFSTKNYSNVINKPDFSSYNNSRIEQDKQSMKK